MYTHGHRPPQGPHSLAHRKNCSSIMDGWMMTADEACRTLLDSFDVFTAFLLPEAISPHAILCAIGDDKPASLHTPHLFECVSSGACVTSNVKATSSFGS